MRCSVNTQVEFVGERGTGNFTQTGGTHALTASLFLANYSTGVGTYNLSGGSLSLVHGSINGPFEDIGEAGIGIFNHSGGTNNINGDAIDLGSGYGSSGTYNLSGTGAITSAGAEFIGVNGTGTFNQSGGTNTITGNTWSLDIAVSSLAVGAYNLSGGTLSVSGPEYVGYSGIGTFTQSAGTNTVSTGYALYLAYTTGASGAYNLSGTGTLSAPSEHIGYAGTGTFAQTGGSNTIGTGILYIGETTGSTGAYTLSGGALSTGSHEYIGYSGNGTFTQTGGTNTIGTSNGLYLAVIGGVTPSTGSYNLGGTGSLSATVEHIGYAGTGTFTQTGGTNLINNSGYLSVGELNGSTGTYTLQGGTLSVHGPEWIGYGGTGTFTQTGGINTIASTYTLNIGYNTGSTGVYTLSSGILSTTSEMIGYSGTGTFTQNGGTHIVTGAAGFVLAENVGSSATYILNAGTLRVTPPETIGLSGTAVYTQTGGLHQALGGISVANNPGSAFNLSGGTLQTPTLNLSGNPALFNWTGGTLNLTSSVTFDGFLPPTPTGGAFGFSLLLGNNQTLMITGDETLGGSTGFYLELAAGSTHTVSGTLTLSPTGMFTGDVGSTLFANNFVQAGGSVAGILQNQGTFTYQSGFFTGRLLNQGTVNLGPVFTADNGIENDATMTVAAGQTITANGAGFDNLGALILNGGTLAGSGYLTNDFGGTMQAHGTINSQLINDGTITINGVLRLNASGNANYGIIQGSGTVIGAVDNTTGGLIQTASGNAPLAFTAFLGNEPGGTIQVAANSTLNITNAWTNSGLITLQGTSAVLGGADFANTNTIQGAGTINGSVSNSGVIRASGGQLALAGAANTNDATGQIQASTGNTVIVLQGLATNAGTIALAGGTFDNNNHPLVNTGLISGNGTIRTGGLTNDATGTISVADAPTSFYGSVANDGNIKMINTTTTFYGAVTNNPAGTIKNTAGTARFLSTFTNNGTYNSDPASNYFHSLAVGSTGALIGGAGDNFIVSGNLVSSSTNPAWNTTGAALRFNGSGAHTLDFSAQSGPLAFNSVTVDAGNTLSITGGTAGRLDVQSLNLQGSATLASGLIVTHALTFAPGSTLDLTSNKMVLDFAGADPYFTYAHLIKNGTIFTSAYPTIGDPALALVDNNMLHIATWHGQTISDGINFNQLLFAYTYAGDNNLDGVVDQTDYYNIIGNMGKINATWTDGDLNGDGIVSLADLSLVTQHLGDGTGGGFGTPLSAIFGPAAATVPEPGTLGLLAVSVLGLLRRKRGSNRGY